MGRNTNTTTAADGTAINWHRDGTGVPVVLVHGITEQAATWDPIVAELEDGFEVFSIDLRGHGASGSAADYGLAAMAADIAQVVADADIEHPHLVGHSLGGAVVSAAGAAISVASVVNLDQSLRLGEFKKLLEAVEPMLRDADMFPDVMTSIFTDLMGPRLSESERDRLTELRRADQAVVLGVWAELFTSTPEEVELLVDDGLAGYGEATVPYLSLFGVDPGRDYVQWLQARIPGAMCEVWPDHGHYPHLVDPDRFVARLTDFWA